MEARERFRLGEIDLDPADRELADELASVTYSLTASGQIQIESKDRMRRSPDRADALTIAMWANHRREDGEAVKALLEDGRRVPPDPLLAGMEPGARALDWHGERRGDWRSRLDPDLPTFR